MADLFLAMDVCGIAGSCVLDFAVRFSVCKKIFFFPRLTANKFYFKPSPLEVVPRIPIRALAHFPPTSFSFSHELKIVVERFCFPKLHLLYYTIGCFAVGHISLAVFKIHSLASFMTESW